MRVTSTQKLPIGAHRGAGEAADQRDGQHDAGRGRQEVLDRQAQHLGQVGHRALAAVVLPVGVGDEGDRGVERQIFRDCRHLGRIEGQRRLQPHQAVDQQHAADMEQQHGDRIGQPVLLAFRIDAADPVDRALDRAQHGRQEGAFAVEYARHVPTERLCQRGDDDAVEDDLGPADGGHEFKPFELPASAGGRPQGLPAPRSAAHARGGVVRGSARLRSARGAAGRR